MTEQCSHLPRSVVMVHSKGAFRCMSAADSTFTLLLGKHALVAFGSNAVTDTTTVSLVACVLIGPNLFAMSRIATTALGGSPTPTQIAATVALLVAGRRAVLYRWSSH